ncbi:MAG: biotin--[acetyl-CoA-carboxylase] ligase [Lachnospiraceae bacterium]|nr:biotin--[acetyl-CoA-carboxylase] ligase [Lachnospiraceae bacterium]
MSVKERVLLLLEENKGEPISGEDIAERLGCTRASVWKAVKVLQSEGYMVEAVNNKGYTLRTSPDVLSEAYIKDKVSSAGIDIEIEARKTVDSTNNILKQLGSDGYKKSKVLIAEEQTAGKGRRGRSFYSPKNTGIYISFLLHPDVAISEASMYTTIAATALAKAIEKVSGFPVDIKWVNDIYMRGKKVSGILTEASTSIEDGTLEFIVVGIGINLYEPRGGFPDDIKDIAGSVYTDNSEVENLRNNIASELIVQFINYYNAGLDGAEFLSDYEKRCFVIGKDVKLLTPDHDSISDEEIVVKVLGINEKCHLHVRFSDGHEEYLSGGEISVRL